MKFRILVSATLQVLPYRMKSSVLIIFFLNFSFGFAQKATLDFLWKVWKDNSKPDTTRLTAMYDFAWVAHRKTHSEKYKLSKLMKFILYISFVLFSFQGIAQSTPELEKQIGSLKIIIANTNSDTVRVNALWEWDNLIYYFDSEQDLKLNKRIEEICFLNIKKDAGKAEMDFYKGFYAVSLNNLGLIYKGKGDYVKSIDYQTISLKVREEIGDKEGIASSLNNIGLIYQDQGDHKKAIIHHERSLKIREEIGDKKGVAGSLGNLSVIFTMMGNYTKAIEYGMRCLEISEKMNDQKTIAGTYNNLGIIYQEKGEGVKAIDYYGQGLKIFEEIGHKKGIAVSLNCIGSICLEKGDYSKAITYCSRAMKIAQESATILEIKGACNTLFEAYKRTGKYDLALQMHERFVIVRDSINSEQSKKELARQEFKYEYDKKVTADSVRTVEEKKVVIAQFKQAQTQRYGLYGGVGLLIVFGAGMFNRFRVAQKQKNVIEKQKETVEGKQKEILASIHYAKRIQQSLLPSEKYIDKSIKRLNRTL